MLHERRSEIIEKVKSQRMVKVSDLMKEYGVSIETIRRDLEYLEQNNHLKRVYGGAVLPGLYHQEPAFTQREMVHRQEKMAIGRAAAQLIDNGDTLIVDVGTTPREVVRHIKDKQELTIITNSTLIAHEVIHNHGCRVLLLGGEMRSGELSVSGFLAEQNLKQFYANKMIMGVGGVSLKTGITDYHMEEANVRRIMIERSERIIAVTDCSKFGVTAANYVCPLNRLDYLVTDWTAPDKLLQEVRNEGVHVIVSHQ